MQWLRLARGMFTSWPWASPDLNKKSQPGSGGLGGQAPAAKCAKWLSWPWASPNFSKKIPA